MGIRTEEVLLPQLPVIHATLDRRNGGSSGANSVMLFRSDNCCCIVCCFTLWGHPFMTSALEGGGGYTKSRQMWTRGEGGLALTDVQFCHLKKS